VIDMVGKTGEATASGNIAPTPDLSRVPGFGTDDAAANRGGRLSGTQVVTLRHHAMGRGAGVAFILVWIYLAWAGGGISLFFALGCVFLAISIYRLARTVSDLMDPKLVVVEGDVRTEEDEGQCTLHVNGYKLSLSGKAYKAVTGGGPYRVFFLERASLVVGAEVLPGWRPAALPTAKKHFPFSIEIG
jgi:hypothetical protein